MSIFTFLLIPAVTASGQPRPLHDEAACAAGFVQASIRIDKDGYLGIISG